MSMTEHPFEGPRSVSPGDCVRLRPTSAYAGRGLCHVVNVTVEGVIVRAEDGDHLVEFRHVAAVLKKVGGPLTDDDPEGRPNED
jgi:hypothetical protein